jgi:hypothetical protein
MSATAFAPQYRDAEFPLHIAPFFPDDNSIEDVDHITVQAKRVTHIEGDLPGSFHVAVTFTCPCGADHMWVERNLRRKSQLKKFARLTSCGNLVVDLNLGAKV